MVCAARSMDEIDAVASQIGGKAIQCDVREEADIRGLMERTLAECGSRPGSVLPVDGNPRRSPRARPVAPLRRRAAASAPRRRVLARLGGGPRAHRPPLPRLDDRGPGAGGRGGAADRTDRSRGSGPARKRGADNPGPLPTALGRLAGAVRSPLRRGRGARRVGRTDPARQSAGIGRGGARGASGGARGARLGSGPRARWTGTSAPGPSVEQPAPRRCGSGTRGR